jgi:hypothetical protein
MADVTKSYVICTPGSGSGDTELTLKAKVANLGNRVNQTDTFTVTAPGVTPNKTFSAVLQAAAEFISWDDGAEASVPKEGGSVVLDGMSNAATITFSKGAGDIIDEDVASIAYRANGAAATSGVAITNDPGATKKYAFVLTLNAAENTTISERTQQITATTSGTKTTTITLKQTAGDPYLNLDKTTVNVPQDGSGVTLNVSTNTTFSIS